MAKAIRYTRIQQLRTWVLLPDLLSYTCACTNAHTASAWLFSSRRNAESQKKPNIKLYPGKTWQKHRHSLCVLEWKNTEIRDGCCFLWGAELQWNTFSKINKWDQTGQQVASYWEVVGRSVIACLPNAEVINKSSDLLKLLQERNWKEKSWWPYSPRNGQHVAARLLHEHSEGF